MSETFIPCPTCQRLLAQAAEAPQFASEAPAHALSAHLSQGHPRETLAAVVWLANTLGPAVKAARERRRN